MAAGSDGDEGVSKLPGGDALSRLNAAASGEPCGRTKGVALDPLYELRGMNRKDQLARDGLALKEAYVIVGDQGVESLGEVGQSSADGQVAAAAEALVVEDAREPRHSTEGASLLGEPLGIGLLLGQHLL